MTMEFARTGSLAWGQQSFWFLNEETFIREYGIEFHLSRPLSVPQGLTKERLQQTLNAAAAAYEALRTMYRVLPDGQPEQCVLAHFEPPQVELTDGPVVPVDVKERPGFRCMVRTDGDVVSEAVLRANQIDIDGFAFSRLAREVERHLVDDGQGALFAGDEAFQPLDCAAAESEEAMQAASARAIEALSGLWREAPRNFLPPAGVAGKTLQLTLNDADLYASVQRYSTTHGVSPASFFHAVVGGAIAAWTQTYDLFLTTAVSNRWRPRSAGLMARIATEVDCRLEFPPGATGADFVRRTHGLLLRAYPYGVRDEEAGVAAKDRIDSESGSILQRPVRIEYLDYQGRQEAAGVAGSRRIEERTTDGGFDRMLFAFYPGDREFKFFLKCGGEVAAPEECRELFDAVIGFADALLGKPEAPLQELLSRIPTRVIPAEADWIANGNSRHLGARIRAVALAHPEVEEAWLEERDGLRCAVAGDRPDLIALHERMLLTASHDPLIRVPTSYAAFTSDSPRGDEPTAVLDVDPDYRPAADDDPRILAIVDVFESCHPGSACDPALSYAAAGGRFTMIPSMVSSLRNAGFESHPLDFTGIASLAAIARSRGE
ncbi:hypothetical protein O1R50_24060 [Glycomyces luteolus]|uniref:Condensation domain-containing protein n=1 Tax=Glycomyces luteolus TaxID=2670330 RepID=A0A9X3PFE6_9ACTN|nr:hypothetical protein [Glycomyces luteolus]MDA1362717.1 hypothetical protein [Glycomyces luteolus]